MGFRWRDIARKLIHFLNDSAAGNESHVPFAAPLCMNTQISIRLAQRSDLGAITDIYNEAIRTTTATFDTEPKGEAEQLAWFEHHDARHPVLVAVSNDKVVGWVSLTAWSDRRAYDDTGEISFYVGSEHRGLGIGRAMVDAMIAEARRLRFHSLIARVAGESSTSLRLSRSSGFVDVGTMKEVGRKFGRLLDVHILQLMLREKSAGNG